MDIVFLLSVRDLDSGQIPETGREAEITVTGKPADALVPCSVTADYALIRPAGCELRSISN
jgi:hypothetical protein